MGTAPVIWWIRRDFRLAENPALTAAVASGAPVVPLFILDEVAEAMPTAPAWRMAQGLEVLARTLAERGSRLITRQGPALEVLSALMDETGARAVHWNRLYDPDAIARDTRVKRALTERGFTAESHAAHVLHEPWTVTTGQGGFYRVYSPLWKAVKHREVPLPEPAPSRLPVPESWPAANADRDGPRHESGCRRAAPASAVGRGRRRGAARRVSGRSGGHIWQDRDRLDMDATSRLSEPLSYGEIGPRTIWHAGIAAMERGAAGGEMFLKELVWRDFAHHLVYHTPQITSANWREGWDSFPGPRRRTHRCWAWKQGRTGVEVIDAAMREMYVTGRMHNRARMLVASYLTKHMMKHWRIAWTGLRTAWWTGIRPPTPWAGNGRQGRARTPRPISASSIRKPRPRNSTPAAGMRGAWIAELPGPPQETALSFFEAVPRSWGLSPQMGYPSAPIVGLKAGRERALAAYEARDF